MSVITLCYLTTDAIQVLTRHRASTSIRWHFAFAYVVTAMKPVHRLQIRPIVHNWRAPPTVPWVTSRSVQ